MKPQIDISFVILRFPEKSKPLYAGNEENQLKHERPQSLRALRFLIGSD